VSFRLAPVRWLSYWAVGTTVSAERKNARKTESISGLDTVGGGGVPGVNAETQRTDGGKTAFFAGRGQERPPRTVVLSCVHKQVQSHASAESRDSGVSGEAGNVPGGLRAGCHYSTRRNSRVLHPCPPEQRCRARGGTAQSGGTVGCASCGHGHHRRRTRERFQ